MGWLISGSVGDFGSDWLVYTMVERVDGYVIYYTSLSAQTKTQFIRLVIN